MRYTSIRFWFCMAAAVIAAAIADPIVEALSNAGVFGPGRFTDHSNLVVIPALLAGATVLLAYIALRVRRALLRASSEALRTHVTCLLPAIVALQVAVLFVMETLEQVVVAGHPMGGMIWLGGPWWFSLSAHAITGIAITFALKHLVCVCTRTTVRVIRQLRALAMRALHDPKPLALRRRNAAFARPLAPVLCRIGNRAPPFSFA